MQKSRNQIFKTLNISLIFLALGVLVAIFLGSFLISCANPKPTPTPIDTTKITGYNGTTDNIIFDNSNNLYFTNDDNDNKTKHVYKVEHDTTNAIELIGKKGDAQLNFYIKLDKNNNLYIFLNEVSDQKWFKVEHDTVNPIELKITGITNKNIRQIWFDKENNMFINYNKTVGNFVFDKVEHDTTNAIELTGINGKLKTFKFDSEDNLWIISNVENNVNLYKINHDTTNAIEIKLNGISDYQHFEWTIDNKDNLYFIKQPDISSPFGTLYRVNKNTLNPIEITGYSKDKVYINSLFLNKDNLYFNDKDDNFYQINNNSTIANKITGYSGSFIDVIVDNENNLWLTNLISIYEIKHDTTNAIELNDTSGANNFNIDKNNNLYFLSIKDKAIYEIEYNTTISKKIEIPEYNSVINKFYFDKSNNLFFIGNNNQLHKIINFIK